MPNPSSIVTTFSPGQTGADRFREKYDRIAVENALPPEYPQAQIDAAVRVASALHTAYHFTDILGHEDVSPGRKVDPGPLFPMNSFRSIVLGRA